MLTKCAAFSVRLVHHGGWGVHSSLKSAARLLRKLSLTKTYCCFCRDFRFLGFSRKRWTLTMRHWTSHARSSQTNSQQSHRVGVCGIVRAAEVQAEPVHTSAFRSHHSQALSRWFYAIFLTSLPEHSNYAKGSRKNQTSTRYVHSRVRKLLTTSV